MRRRLYRATGRWRRSSRREEVQKCGERCPGRRVRRWRTGEGMKQRREVGDSSEGKRWLMVTPNSLLEDIRNVNHRDNKAPGSEQ